MTLEAVPPRRLHGVGFSSLPVSDQIEPTVDATANRENSACTRCGFCQHAWLRSKPFPIAVKGMSS